LELTLPRLTVAEIKGSEVVVTRSSDIAEARAMHGLARALINKARGHDRTVVSHVYSPAAVALIERELRSRGHRRIESDDAFA